MKINVLKIYIIFILLLVLTVIPYFSFAGSRHLFFAIPESEEFTQTITVYHPVSPPREIIHDMPIRERYYVNYPAYIRGDLQEFNEESAYFNEPPTSFEAPDCHVRIPTEYGDTLIVEAVIANVSFINFDMQVFPSGRGEGWFDIVFSGIPAEMDNVHEWPIVYFAVSSSIVPIHKLYSSVTAFVVSAHEYEIYQRNHQDELDGLDGDVMEYSGCCYPCETDNVSLGTFYSRGSQREDITGEAETFRSMSVGVDMCDNSCECTELKMDMQRFCGNVQVFEKVFEVGPNGQVYRIDHNYALLNFTLKVSMSPYDHCEVRYEIQGISNKYDAALSIVCSQCPCEMSEDPARSDLDEGPGRQVIWINDIPSFAMGLTDISSLEFMQTLPTSGSVTVNYDTTYSPSFFPSRIALDGTGPSEITIHEPVMLPWRSAYAQASFQIYPLSIDPGASGTVEIEVSCAQADFPGPHTLVFDPADGYIPDYCYFGYITPNIDHYNVNIELTQGNHVVFDQVILSSDSLSFDDPVHNVFPRYIYLGSPRTVGLPTPMELSVGTGYTTDINDVALKVVFENLDLGVVYDTIDVTENSELIDLAGGEVFYTIDPDQSWTPITAGMYQATMIVDGFSNMNWVDDTLRTPPFRVHPAGLIELTQTSMDSSVWWSDTSMTASSCATRFTTGAANDFALSAIRTRWHRPGNATLRVRADSSGLPGADLVAAIPLTATFVDSFPIVVETSLPDSAALDTLTEFWVELDSPQDGAALKLGTMGDGANQSYWYRNGGWQAITGEWHIDAIGVADLTTLSGNVSGSLKKIDSPFLVTGDITVPYGSSLTIDPGVTLLFEEDVLFHVNGTLTASGQSNDNIYLLSAPGEGRWDGISFTGSSSGNTLKFVQIQHAETGVYANDAQFSDMSDLVVSNCGTGISFEKALLDVTTATVSKCETGIYSYLNQIDLLHVYVHDCENSGIYLDNVTGGTMEECVVEEKRF